MPHRVQEQRVIARFSVHLGQMTGRVWASSADEVSTGKNSRKYDCEFTSQGATPIAADICSLFPAGGDPGEQAQRARFNGHLLKELRDVGEGGLMIETPPIEKKHANPNWYRNTVQKIAASLSQQSLSGGGATIEVEGCRIERIAGKSEPSFTYHSHLIGIQPVDAAGYALVRLLRHKHEQLDVDNHQRLLIVVNDGCRAYATDVRNACALIPFDLYPNFDQIYFEESETRFYLIYDRQAWHLMESGSLPENEGQRGLVTSWLETRLSGSWPGALDAVLRVCCDLHTVNWLTEGGQATLELEAHLFLQRCEWETPRRFWELFRGPLPRIGDGRHRAAPIEAPPA